MNKKSHKKKQKKRGKHEVRNKENVIEDVPVGNDDKGNKTESSEVIKEQDKPCYEIKHSDVMGRYLVASRDIEAGEVIVEAPALAVGPCSGCGLVCLGCYRELDETNLFKCPGCQWPLCCSACPGLGLYTGHASYECAALAGSSPNYDDIEDLKESYHAIMPLRCLLLQSAAPARWAELRALESHNELRRARGDVWPANERLVLRRLRAWGLRYPDLDAHTVCGVLEVNAFEVGGGDASARALYAGASLLAHCCTPSTTHTDAERRARRPLTVRAAVPHRAGDLISLCYAYTLQGTLKRREHIRLSKFFECSCRRCADPTELGTYASALRCPRCAGPVLPAAPLDPAAAWRCLAPACPYAMSAAAVRAVLDRLTEELEQIDANDVAGFERFLHRHRAALGAQHYLRLGALHSLSQLYGRAAGHVIHELPETQLRRKLAVCRDLMRVFDVLEPGLSRLRGITLYELHAPLMVLTTRDFERKAISKDILRTRLKEVVSCLRESALILGFEPPQSPEGLMAAAARDALKKIKTWEQIIGKFS